MSVESFVIAGMVEDGTPRAAFQAGVTADDFTIYDDEFKWMVERAERRKPITQRSFLQRFPDFDWTPPKEKVNDLLEELKAECAYRDFRALMDVAENDLTPDNVTDIAGRMREQLGRILRVSNAQSEILVSSAWEEHLAEIYRLRDLRSKGVAVSIPTGIENIDHHWGGLVNGRLIVILARPGEGKSTLLAKFAWEAKKNGFRLGIFSPEMSKFEHLCRIHTYASADKDTQTALGLRSSFRNRALMDGHGFPLKKYKRFLQYFEELPGEIVIFDQKYRKQKMTPQFIESRIDDLGLDGVIIDPIYKLRPPIRRGNKVEELQDITDAVEHMAEAYNIPVVITNQAGRHLTRSDTAPGKDASFGSDAPVQEADHVIGVLYDEEEHILFLSCTKSRFSGTFRVKLKFYPNIGLMKEITPVKGDYFNGHEDTDAETIAEAIEKAEGTDSKVKVEEEA